MWNATYSKIKEMDMVNADLNEFELQSHSAETEVEYEVGVKSASTPKKATCSFTTQCNFNYLDQVSSANHKL